MTPERAFQLARSITESAGAVGFTAAVAGAILEAWRQGCERSARECDNMCHDALRRASMSADAEKAQPSRNAAENYAACATKIRALFEQGQTKEGGR